MTVTTFYPDASPETSSVDGFTGYAVVNSSWATLHDAADGNSTDDTLSVLLNRISSNSSSSGLWTDIYRTIIVFDTSSIPDTDTVSSATLSVYGTTPDGTPGSLSQSTNVYSATPASNTAVVNADYDQVGTTAFSTAITHPISTAGYNDFALNASGIANISKTGGSKFSLRNVDDATNTEPTWALARDEARYYGAEQAGTTNDPKLVVTHAFVATAVTQDNLLLLGVS